MRHFWITGYERSRTTWLSVLFTRGASWCEHDLGKTVAPDAMRDAIKARAPEGTESAGNADTGLPLVWRRVVRDEEPVLLVLRPKDEAMEATMRAFHLPEDGRPRVAALFDLYEREFEAMRRNASVLALSWGAFDERDTAELAWEHLLPGQPFDAAWWNHLRTKRITER